VFKVRFKGFCEENKTYQVRCNLAYFPRHFVTHYVSIVYELLLQNNKLSAVSVNALPLLVILLDEKKAMGLMNKRDDVISINFKIT
jgi:hypothetical protein